MATRRHSGTRLDRRDWVDAGIVILASKGVDAVRVESLAKQLNISKGSFYWHFKDRGDLLEAILERWEIQQSDWNTDGERGSKAPRLFVACFSRDWVYLSAGLGVGQCCDVSVPRLDGSHDAGHPSGRKRTSPRRTAFAFCAGRFCAGEPGGHADAIGV